MKKYKILMTTMGLDIGGAETHIVELAKELTKRGYDVSVASNGGVYVEELEAAGIKPGEEEELAERMYVMFQKCISPISCLKK